jgi:hypothetical protein
MIYRDDRNINLDYTRKNAKDRAALDLAEQEVRDAWV